MASSEHRYHAELEFALAAARRAGDFTLPAFHAERRHADEKADGSLVTKTDKDTEHLLRDLCEQAFPDDGFLGEEFGEAPSRSGRRWIADPIDGTISFVHGVPLYGTLLALEVDGKSKVGIIHMPALGETIFAAEGTGAWRLAPGSHAPVPARVRTCSTLNEAVFCATSPDYFSTPALRALLLRVLDQATITRGWSDCYAHVLLATGRADVVIEPGVKPWDIAASTIIMAEAGGLCTDWEGIETAYSGNALLTAGTLHQSVLELIRSSPT